MKLRKFFKRSPVFTTEEMMSFLREQGSSSRWTCKSLLAYHVKQGRILRVRRGFYATIPEGVNSHEYSVDPYLLASKITNDAVLSHHTALEYHGCAYSTFYRFTYLSSKPSQSFTFQSVVFKGLRFPMKLVKKRKELFGVTVSSRLELDVRVTSLERTVVDLLDRPRWGGSWEEIWRSLESIEFFNLDHVIEYALLLENSSTIAKVGFFLEQHRENLMVEESHLKILKKHRTKSPHYFDRNSKKPGRFLKEWNLVVPLDIIERSWEEPHEDI